MKIHSIFLLFSIFLLSCESHFAETSPDKVESKEISIDLRMQEKQKGDLLLKDLFRGIHKINKVVNLYNKFQNIKSHEFSMVHFLMLIESEMSEKIPETTEEGVLSRKTKINLSTLGLSSKKEFSNIPCSFVEVALELNQLLLNSKLALSSEEPFYLVFSARPCGNGQERYPIAVLTKSNNHFEFKFDSNLINKILKIENKTSYNDETRCHYNTTSYGSMLQLFCENIILHLNSGEVIHFKTLKYDLKNENEFISEIQFIMNEEVVRNLIFIIKHNGEMKLDLIKDKL